MDILEFFEVFVVAMMFMAFIVPNIVIHWNEAKVWRLPKFWRRIFLSIIFFHGDFIFTS